MEFANSFLDLKLAKKSIDKIQVEVKNSFEKRCNYLVVN